MPIEKAKNYFLGKNTERLDCARAILKAFAKSEAELKDCLCRGGGRAPGGECGAYCAAKYLLQKSAPEKLKDFEGYFSRLAGSLKCAEIRKLKKLSCLDCVGKAVEYLYKIKFP